MSIVELYMYNVSPIPPSISKIDIIWWHTSIVVFSNEYYFGRNGIVVSVAKQTEFSVYPLHIEVLGITSKTEEELNKYLETKGLKKFNRNNYSLIKWNCNNFTDDISKYLLSSGIPQNILDLPYSITREAINKLVLVIFFLFLSYYITKIFDIGNSNKQKWLIAFLITFILIQMYL